MGDETASGLVSLASNSTVWDEPADSLETDNIAPRPAKPLLPRAPMMGSRLTAGRVSPRRRHPRRRKNSLQGVFRSLHCRT